MIRYTLCSLLLLFHLIPINAQNNLRFIGDIPYVTDGDNAQTLDLYLPNNSHASLPIIFMVHGGGFIAGDKSEMQGSAEYYAELGYAVISPNYRLAPDFTYPTAHADVFCALAWTLTHAEDYNLDPNRLILMGESAGANTVALLATMDAPNTLLDNCEYQLPADLHIEAVFAMYMPVDLSSCECQLAKRFASIYLGINLSDWEDAETQSLWQSASIIKELDRPTLLSHSWRE